MMISGKEGSRYLMLCTLYRHYDFYYFPLDKIINDQRLEPTTQQHVPESKQLDFDQFINLEGFNSKYFVALQVSNIVLYPSLIPERDILESSVAFDALPQPITKQAYFKLHPIHHIDGREIIAHSKIGQETYIAISEYRCQKISMYSIKLKSSYPKDIFSISLVTKVQIPSSDCLTFYQPLKLLPNQVCISSYIQEHRYESLQFCDITNNFNVLSTEQNQTQLPNYDFEIDHPLVNFIYQFKHSEKTNTLRLTTRELKVTKCDGKKSLNIDKDFNSEIILKEQSEEVQRKNYNARYREDEGIPNEWWQQMSIQLNKDTFAVMLSDGIRIVKVMFE
ncbi:hypothetical protein FGO68_gene8783 [Halteria grandinella]|uniref:Uncharacterized protein n=1 Tax=Halteria grandinella TaxID=5974 RepID=A0A8J8T8B5_HALGN|nr:hypothetical protein FGO68_gene8783 [Halteria grandinella]